MPLKKTNKKPNGMVSLQKKIIDKKLTDRHLLEELKIKEIKLKKSDNKSKYVLYRKFSDYNLIFRKILNSNVFSLSKTIRKDIISTLRTLEKKFNKKEINVLDDGAGRGFFLSELKEKWDALRKQKKVKAELKTTAVSLTKTISAKGITFKEIGNVLNLVPSRKYDLIISVYGAFHYIPSDLKKEVLLKYLYSLNKGGMGVFGFSDLYPNNFTRFDQSKSIKKALEKRGFAAEFVNLPEKYLTRSPDLPNIFLFVERVK